MFASSSIIKLREKRTSALNLQVCSSNFKYSRGLNVIFHDHMDSREQAAAMIINKYFDENFDFMKHFVQSWPVVVSGDAITDTY